MKWRVTISYKKGVQDSEGTSTLQGLRTLGFDEVQNVSTAKVYLIEGEVQLNDLEEMCKKLLANPVSQDYTITRLE